MEKLIKLPKVADPRGNLSFIQSGKGGACPFEISKVLWVYDLPATIDSSLTSDPSAEALFVALSGCFDSEGLTFRTPDSALLTPDAQNTHLTQFATNTVIMMLGAGESAPVAEEDFIDPHPSSSVNDCRIVMLDRHPIAGGGSWSEVDNTLRQIPFSVRRVFYLYDVPADATRGGHSHFQAQELIVAMAGSFDVVLDDGKNPPRRFTLNRPYQGLYIPTGIWRTLENFSGGAVSTVLTSHPYSEPDYVREYSDFKALTNPK